MKQPEVSILDFTKDKNLLGIFLYPEQQRILSEFWQGDYSLGLLALGRRSGKTLLAAISACYVATVLSAQYQQYLRPKERWFCLAVATNQEQSKIFLNMVRDLLQNSRILAPMVTRSTADQIELINGCVFRSLPSSGRGSRGMAVGFLVMDEAAHFIDNNGNNSGDELYQSLTPSIAQFGKLGRVLLTSSPWIQSGLFYNLYSKANQGELPRAYCANEPSWLMNPTLSSEFLDEQRILLGADVFEAEYGGRWTNNISSFLPSELVDASVNHNRNILPPSEEFKGRYVLSLDPSKGGRDDYIAVIVHYEGETLVVDKWHEFSPSWSNGGKRSEISIAEVESWIIQHDYFYKFNKAILDQYNSQSTIQRLAGQLPVSELTWTTPTKMKAFTKLRELFTSAKIELYPHAKAIKQLKNLVVTYHSSGSWGVSGGAGIACDDYALALAGAVLAAQSSQPWEWLQCYSIR